MKTNKKVILVAMVALIVLAMAAAPAMARYGQRGGRGMGAGPAAGHRMGHGMGHGFGPFWKNPEVAEDLQLTDRQIEQLEALSDDFAADMIDLEAAMKKAHLEYGQAMDQYPPNANAIKKAAQAVSAAQADMLEATGAHHVAVISVLSEEQFNKLKTMPRSKKRGRGQGQQNRGQRGQRGQGR